LTPIWPSHSRTPSGACSSVRSRHAAERKPLTKAANKKTPINAPRLLLTLPSSSEMADLAPNEPWLLRELDFYRGCSGFAQALMRAAQAHHAIRILTGRTKELARSRSRHGLAEAKPCSSFPLRCSAVACANLKLS